MTVTAAEFAIEGGEHGLAGCRGGGCEAGAREGRWTELREAGRSGGADARGEVGVESDIF